MIIVFSVLFLLNPVISVFLYGLYLNSNKKSTKRTIYFFYFLLSALLAFINMTKVPENDLAFHGNLYLAAEGVNIFEYFVKTWSREFVFYTFNYVFYYLSNGSLKLWIMMISICGYFSFFIGIHKFQKAIYPKSNYILFAICLGAFFPQLFSLSAHLIRQFLAGSLALYFIVDKVFYKNNKWWVLVAALLIHSTIIIYFIVLFIPFLRERPNLKNIWKYFFLIVGLAGYQLLASLLLPIFSGTPGIEYVLTRASKDTEFDLGGFPLINYIFILSLILIMLKNIYFSKLTKEINGLQLIGNLVFIQIIFILANVQQSELSNRLFFYLYFFFPLIIPLQLKSEKFKELRRIITISLLSFFIIRLNSGVWEYDSVWEIITSTTFEFLTRREFVI